MSTPNDKTNDNLLLIVGKATSGKSAGLRNLINPEGVLYLNCESGKKLPFRSKFTEKVITDPMLIHGIFQMFIDRDPAVDSFHTVVVDSLTYMMDMYETQYVLTATNTMQAWGAFAQYFKKLMQEYVAACPCNVIFTAHVSDQLSDDSILETCVPIKGSLKNNGIESYFSTVIAAKRVTLLNLDTYKEGNTLLNITEEEEILGFKHVFQTRLTKKTAHERLRSSFNMWSREETFIDNDAQLVLNRLHEYYA